MRILEKDDILNAAPQVMRNCQGIYFLIHGNEIVYIGQTFQIKTRVSTHIRKGKVFTRCFFIELSQISDVELSDVERTYILKFRPKGNKRFDDVRGLTARELDELVDAETVE